MLELLASTLSHERVEDAASALATELAAAFECDRVSIGFVDRDYAEVKALSHSADFKQSQELIREIQSPMDEAIQQAPTVVYPEPKEELPKITLAHAELARRGGAVLSAPLVHSKQNLGAITFERGADRPFDVETVKLIEHVASFASPVLMLKREIDRPFRQRLKNALHRPWVSGNKFALKIVVAMVALALVLLAQTPVTFRVSAAAGIEGSMQRVLVAPSDGLLRQVNVRPGDDVQAGQVLATLEQEDLLLERRKCASEIAQAENAFGEALAKHDRAQIAILRARIDEGEAQLALTEQQLKRTEIVAPITGLLLKGDLTQALGAPVKRGEVLLTIAPRDEYRVIVEVDERDIAFLHAGQSCALALAASPHEQLPIEVQRITPIAEARGGRNTFAVEAKLKTEAANLRPGQSGVAKIATERRVIGWIWSRRAVDWLRLAAWGWVA